MVTAEVTKRIALTEEQYNEKLNEMPNVFVDFSGSVKGCTSKTVHTFFDAKNPSKGRLERVWYRSNDHIEYFFNPEF